MFYVFFGLIASGKSTLAEEFARRNDLPYYNTDRVRKELAGIGSSRRTVESFGEGLYSPEMTSKTYQVMLAAAASDIRAGRTGAVLDGSYHRRAERSRVVNLAEELGTEYIFIQCVCSEGETRRRLAERSRDPLAVSDGRWEIYTVQKERFEPPDELDTNRLLTLDTEQPPEQLLARLKSELAGRNNEQ